MAISCRAKIKFVVEDTRLNCKNGTPQTRTYFVRDLTESACLSELKRRIPIKDYQEIIILDYEKA